MERRMTTLYYDWMGRLLHPGLQDYWKMEEFIKYHFLKEMHLVCETHLFV